jgi:hypothetical protein
VKKAIMGKAKSKEIITKGPSLSLLFSIPTLLLGHYEKKTIENKF